MSIVTQDWRWRMVTPPKGDYQGVQMTPEAAKVADAWDPAKDEAAGEQCKSYGAPALMSVPGRLHITWQDDNTLKVETDAGTQTRLLHFGRGPATPRAARRAAHLAGGVGGAVAEPRPNVPLKLRPADRAAARAAASPGRRIAESRHDEPPRRYLRKNGVPYSENAVLTEHRDLYKQRRRVADDHDDGRGPRYLRNARLIAPIFKKEADGGKWDPTPCSARW